jgi:peroxiredoxin family protein
MPMLQQASDDGPAVTASMTEDDLRRIVREEIHAAFAKDPGGQRCAIIASKGTLDWAYPPLIIATTAAATGMETSIFFTFYGLNIITKDFTKHVKVGTTGNPAMPMPIPMADVVSGMPGMKAMATSMMKSKFSKKGVATIDELLGLARDTGVRLIACRMTMDVFGYDDADFIDGVEFAGAASFISDARKAHVTLFV